MDKQIVTLNNSISNAENTFDVNLQEVFGNQRLVNTGNVRTEVTKYVDSPVKSISIGTAYQELGIDCNGWNTVIVDISGTFVATLTLEVSFFDGQWSSIGGTNVSTNAVSSTITSVGIVRAPIAGATRFRVRCTAWTSGTAIVMLKVSTAPYVVTGNTIVGTVPISGTGIGTSDANIVTLLGASGASPTALNASALVRPAQEPAPIGIVAPLQNTTYPSNFISRMPQYYARLRVESGGDQKLPFAQEQNNNRLITSDEEGYSLFESIDLELKALNYMIMVAFNVNPPSWYSIIDK